MATLKMGTTTVLTDTTLANAVQDNVTRLGTVTAGTFEATFLASVKAIASIFPVVTVPSLVTLSCTALANVVSVSTVVLPIFNVAIILL